MRTFLCLFLLIFFTLNLNAQIFKKHGVKAAPPAFLQDLNSQRSEVAYFGFGAQSFVLQPTNASKTTNTDAVNNGVAFNLGYFTRDWIAEYTQHILLTELSENLVVDNDAFGFINAVQHHFLVQLPKKIFQNLHFSFGGGLQLSELHLFSAHHKQDEKLQHEYALLIGLGFTFFMTKTVAIQAQFTRSMATPLLNDSRESIFQMSEIATVFLEYYFNLK